MLYLPVWQVRCSPVLCRLTKVRNEDSTIFEYHHANYTIQMRAKLPTVTTKLPTPGLYPNPANERIVMTRSLTHGLCLNRANARIVMTRLLTPGPCLNSANVRMPTTSSITTLPWRDRRRLQHHMRGRPETY